MGNLLTLTDRQLRILKVALNKGMAGATNALSEMIGRDLSVAAVNVEFIPINQVPDMAGGPDVGVTSVYVAVEGDIHGHMMLMMDLPSANSLADILLEKMPGETIMLDDMDRSALEEVGNVTGSFFLSALVDHAELDVRPSPPSCAVDMAGALLSSVLADVSKAAEQVLTMETIFTVSDQQIKGFFFLFPEPESLNILLKAIGAK